MLLVDVALDDNHVETLITWYFYFVKVILSKKDIVIENLKLIIFFHMVVKRLKPC
jgi:hypothetical protein